MLTKVFCVVLITALSFTSCASTSTPSTNPEMRRSLSTFDNAAVDEMVEVIGPPETIQSQGDGSLYTWVVTVGAGYGDETYPCVKAIVAADRKIVSSSFYDPGWGYCNSYANALRQHFEQQTKS